MKHKVKFHHRLLIKLYDTDEPQPKMEGITDVQIFRQLSVKVN